MLPSFTLTPPITDGSTLSFKTTVLPVMYSNLLTSSFLTESSALVANTFRDCYLHKILRINALNVKRITAKSSKGENAAHSYYEDSDLKLILKNY